MSYLKIIVKRVFPSSLLVRALEVLSQVAAYLKIVLIKAKGLYPKSAKSAKAFKTYTMSLSEAERIAYIKFIASDLKKKNDQKGYNHLVKAFVPKWNFSFDSSSFVGAGTNINTLNATRKIVVGDTLLFEKIYFANEQEWETFSWFEDNLYAHVKTIFNIARLYSSYESEILNIVYSDFFELERLEKSRWYESFSLCVKQLYEFSNKNQGLLNLLPWPVHMRDYSLNNKYKNKISAADEQLQKQGLSVSTLKTIVSQSKYVVTHNDINAANIFKHNTLIDWDNMGYFPLGLEFAYIYINSFYRAEIKNYNDWLAEFCGEWILKEDGVVLKRNFLYFIFVLGYSHIDQRFYSKYGAALLSEIEIAFSNNYL